MMSARRVSRSVTAPMSPRREATLAESPRAYPRSVAPAGPERGVARAKDSSSSARSRSPASNESSPSTSAIHRRPFTGSCVRMIAREPFRSPSTCARKIAFSSIQLSNQSWRPVRPMISRIWSSRSLERDGSQIGMT